MKHGCQFAARRYPPSRARAGFSLVEILGVLVVFGLISSIVVANWHSILPRQRLNSAVRALGATLQGTRSDAIAQNAEFRIEYDFDLNAYRVVTPFLLGGGFARSYEDQLKFEWSMLPEGVRFHSIVIDGVDYDRNPNDTGVYVRFDPLGASSAHTIVLSQPAYEQFFTVEVLGLTGLIRFHEQVFVREVPNDGDFQ